MPPGGLHSNNCTCPSCGYTFTPTSASNTTILLIDDSRFNFSSNASFFDFPRLDPKKILAQIKGLKAMMTEAELAIYREWNFKPTWNGIESCRHWHRQVVSFLKTLPNLHVRFDRRVPCWRAGRWKSLTA